MKNLRKQIDEIDQQIIKLLAERISTAKAIGKFKKEAEMPVYDKKREIDIRSKLKKLSKKNGLSAEFINHLYTHIFIESANSQKKD